MKKSSLVLSAVIIIILSVIAFSALKKGPETTVEKKVTKTVPKVKPVESKEAALPGIPANSVVTSIRWLAGKKFAVDFFINNANSKPVFGAAINLSYPNEMIKYLSYQKGVFLELGNNSPKTEKPIYLITKKTQENEDMVIIGASLFRGTPGVAGSGKLLTLIFKMEKEQPTEIVFLKKKLKSLKADNIDDVKWPESIKIDPAQRKSKTGLINTM